MINDSNRDAIILELVKAAMSANPTEEYKHREQAGQLAGVPIQPNIDGKPIPGEQLGPNAVPGEHL
jgi:hypothetical protein